MDVSSLLNLRLQEIKIVDSLRLKKAGRDSGFFLLVPIGVFYCFMSYSYMSFDYFIKIKSI